MASLLRAAPQGRRRSAGTIVITGGAGLIGGAVAGLLAGRGQAVAVVEALRQDDRFRNLAGVPLVGYWHRDEFLLLLRSQHIAAPSAVVHLGACTATTESDGDFLMANNFGYTRTLATWCLNHGVRFIYASSAATYGAGEFGYGDDLDGIGQLRPLNKYAFSKHAFDLWAQDQGAFAGPGGITGLKYFNVYGPNEQHKGEMRSMVLKAYEQIQETGKVRLFKSYRAGFADGEQERDFIYVKDAAAITAWFLDHPEASGIYNVGTGVARTWNDLAGAVFAALERPVRIEYVDMPENIRPAYQYSTCADLARLRAAGCGLRLHTLEEGVRDYVREHLLAARGGAA